MISKKGKFNFGSSWGELFFIVLLVIGFFLSIALHKAPLVSYILIFLFGLGVGRRIWQKKSNLLVGSVIVTCGFLVGYLTGIFYGNKLIFILLFALGTILSFYIHSKGFVE